MRFEVFGRILVVERIDDEWSVFYSEEGKRRSAPDIRIPPDVPAPKVEEYLVDLLHEFATPDDPGVRRLD